MSLQLQVPVGLLVDDAGGDRDMGSVREAIAQVRGACQEEEEAAEPFRRALDALRRRRVHLQ